MLTSALIAIKESAQEKGFFDNLSLSRRPSSVLSRNVVDTLKVRTKKPATKVKKQQAAKRKKIPLMPKLKTTESHTDEVQVKSSMSSSKKFFDHFDSPLDLLNKQSHLNEEISEQEDEVYEEAYEDIEAEAFSEKVLVEQEKDAMKVALEMDNEIKMSKGVF